MKYIAIVVACLIASPVWAKDDHKVKETIVKLNDKMTASIKKMKDDDRKNVVIRHPVVVVNNHHGFNSSPILHVSKGFDFDREFGHQRGFDFRVGKDYCKVVTPPIPEPVPALSMLAGLVLVGFVINRRKRLSQGV